MTQQNTRFDFGDSKTPTSAFVLYEYIIADRGSRYSVSIGQVHNRDEIKNFLRELKSKKRYDKADHHSFAARITHEGVLYETKHDDGETGAGIVILRQLQAANVSNCVIVVTRWFGGVKLMGDRFKHIQDATRYALERLSYIAQPCTRQE